MKKYIVTLLLVISSLLSHAKESKDQSILVKQLLGKWKCTEFSRLEDMPKDMKFPVVEYTFEFLSGGKVISNATIDGKVYPEAQHTTKNNVSYLI